jgi:hypothetical protein
VPVFFSCRDKDNITGRYPCLFVFCGNDAVSGGYYQNLFTAVGMKFIAHTLAEIHYVYTIHPAVREQFLYSHIKTRNYRFSKGVLLT